MHIGNALSLTLNELDLNLLVALDALLQEQSVGRAALRVGLSQPAMSHALARLRRQIADPILVRVGLHMLPTPRAEQLRRPLAQALRNLREVLAPEQFDSASSTRTFRLMFPDLVADILLPSLIEHLSAKAPGIRLEFVPWRGPMTVTEEYLQSVDLIAAHRPEERIGFRRQDFYVDRDVLAVRKGHSQIRALHHVSGFQAASHVAVVGSGEREDPIAAWLLNAGLQRRVILTVPSYLQALRVAARTDLVAFVPGRLLSATKETLKLVEVRPPIDPGIDPMYLFYSARTHADPGAVWLRNLVLASAKALPVTTKWA
jgi:DNA-binding transcriptional LysR family regulator